WCLLFRISWSAGFPSQAHFRNVPPALCWPQQRLLAPLLTIHFLIGLGQQLHQRRLLAGFGGHAPGAEAQYRTWLCRWVASHITFQRRRLQPPRGLSNLLRAEL